MALDDDLVAEVEKARQHLEHLEAEVFRARADFHAAIRTLHEAGGSMREIATALGMSHQRVHQIIGDDAVVEVDTTSTDVTPHPAAPADEVTETIRTSMRRRPAFRCSFCNASQAQVAKLIAGPQVYICGSCVAAALEVASTGEATSGPRRVVLQPAKHESHKCSFCSLRTPKVATMVKGPRARICNECLDLCERILSDDTDLGDDHH